MPKKQPPFDDPAVRAVFDAYPPKLRADLLALRALILDTAAKTDGVGPLVETLKWGQPSYLPARPRIGTTVRIDALKHRPDGYALFVHCQSRLADAFRQLYPGQFTFDGNRALLFTAGQPRPDDALTHCIALALTHHLRKRRPKAGHDKAAANAG